MQPQSTTIIPDYLLLVRRRWRVLAAGALAGLALAALWSVLHATEPATSRLLLTGPSKRGFVLPQPEVATLAALAQSNQVLIPVSRELGLNESPSALRGDVIGSQSATASGVIEITVTHGSTDESLRMVQAITTQMRKAITQVAASVKGHASRVTTTVVDPGSTGSSASSPAVAPTLVLGGIAGLGIGLAAAILIELATPRVRDPRGLSDDFGLGALGAIQASPALRYQTVILASPEGSRRDGSAQDRKLAAVGEQFRRLRANIQAISFRDRPRSLLVASAVDGEGKTLIACNLAAALALAGERVMLLDCNLRHPDASAQLGLERGPGLIQVLRGEAGVEEASAERHGFAVIPAGGVPPNPSELLASREMSDLLVRLDDGERLVIIDTPAVLAFADAAELAPRCGDTMMVVCAGRTRTRQLEEALIALRAVGAEVAGAVLNRTPAPGGMDGSPKAA